MSTPRTAYTSPDGRTVVLCHGPRRYERVVDGVSHGFYTACYRAQHAITVPPVQAEQPDTPLATLNTGETIYGQHDTDGTPGVVTVKTGDGHITADGDGGFTVAWAGQYLEFTTNQAPALRALFASNLLNLMDDVGRVWTGGGTSSNDRPVSFPLAFGFSLAAAIERNRGRFGLSMNDVHEIAMIICKVMEKQMPEYEIAWLPALEEAEARMEAAEQDEA